MKVLVCRNRARAESLIETLDLAGWTPFGFGQPLLGHKFEKCVVIATTDLTEHEARWIVEELPLKMAPGAQVEFR